MITALRKNLTTLACVTGLFALLLLVYMPIRQFVSNSPSGSKVILVTLVFYSLFTMGHAATRLAAVGFIYGLGFIHLIPNNPLIREKKSSNNK